MPATIIQSNAQPFDSVEVDPVTLDIIENALRHLREEMDATLVRTAMSPAIREQGDAFPLVTDRDGRMIVGQMGSFLQGFLANYEGTIEEGDVIWLSDAYACEGAISHNNDWVIFLPVFHEGRLIGWVSMFGHQTDVGGKTPGSLPTDGTSIFQEGIRIPPVKIYRKGVFNDELLALVLHQVRIPEWNRSDLNALVASCRTAERRMRELCERFGVDTYVSSLDLLLERNYRAVKELIARNISTEPISFEDYVCDDGAGFGPYKLKCTMWREGEKVILDLDGTDPQSPSSINYLLNENVQKMFFGAYLIKAFDPQILINDGFYPLVEVRVPEGSILRPKFPAALSCRTHTLSRLFDVMGALLGQKTPQFLNAAGTSTAPHLMYSGYDSEDEFFQLFQIGFGGIPARPHGDGPDGHSMWPDFTNVPNEFLERYFPIRIERYETIPDSGGAGFFRGGNGMLIAYRFLEPGVISIHDDRWLLYPWGVNGGEPGSRSSKILYRTDGSVEVVAPKIDNIRVSSGDLLHFLTWGGGGWGDPLQRDPENVALEVRRGLISSEGARRYGVVLTGEDQVDGDSTLLLRRSMLNGRGELPLFNYGGTLDEILERCHQETGLSAPVRPSWADRRSAQSL
ncbi:MULTISPECIES: hydantoinase B/oxoprolinase family protein [unclassified Sphingomonas]|uniref:hydantoinase B/oxoprolinase family protein n=1 Tax=unclassified Sphingomonas TaxID=196159 RepID=UPI0006FE479A|nr:MULTISPECIES: hydantoinase B/oxoprolinase family protein [unclassified Sphingomonas]KQX19107.1 5-oxoprolinase [Sphingomonas sp. Root1294]KQY65308.1 5-oxoprolinase [Sphingomonas sp. Root50]KRB95397.1 5-oxoprolinase [Sphingomonas sp. Root720]